MYARFGARNVSGVSLYSTAAPRPQGKFRDASIRRLFRRISPELPSISIVPILDQWIGEGETVNKSDLVTIINELRHYKRYKQALEISMWMTDKRFYPLTRLDFANRLDLIAKVLGTEQAENYFNNIPSGFRVAEVYIALLNCYGYNKQVEKAEAVMQQMKDMGLSRTPSAYNALLNLYYQSWNHEKMDFLMREMDEKGIRLNKFTYGIRLSAYAAESDVEGINKVLARMESDPEIVLDWLVYSVAANGFTKAGLADEALAALKKSEALLSSAKKWSTAFECLLTQYAAIGKKQEVLRLWELYKMKQQVYNGGYISIITSLLKLGDIESAEKIFEEWGSRQSKSKYDIRIPNFLIGACCRKGLLEKAEALVAQVKVEGGKPNVKTWSHLTTGYCVRKQTHKAVESIKEEISVAEPWWKLSKDNVAVCLDYLIGKGDVEQAEEIIRLLKDKDFVSMDGHERLLNKIKEKESISQEMLYMNGYDHRWKERKSRSLEANEDSSSEAGFSE
ncbi:pentatricopeptide repeat-containing protein At2g20710, mitochondrial [Morus notabilis]|nr:pentatricopeptide repeat-containing protein At2g20710, mitochondrial [Morus notabilis]